MIPKKLFKTAAGRTCPGASKSRQFCRNTVNHSTVLYEYATRIDAVPWRGGPCARGGAKGIRDSVPRGLRIGSRAACAEHFCRTVGFCLTFLLPMRRRSRGTYRQRDIIRRIRQSIQPAHVNYDELATAIRRRLR